MNSKLSDDALAPIAKSAIIRISSASLFIIPALVVLGWLIFSTDIIWNDYPVYQLRYAQIYRFYLSQGIEPLWYPHIEMGMPTGGQTMSQAFHLPAWLIAQHPWFWSGDGLKLFSIKHMILCALSQGALYFALRSFGQLSKAISFVLSFLFIYHLRTLDAIRYGTLNDAYTYFLIASICGLYYLKTGRILLLLLVSIATQLMISCGYQPIVSYGLVALFLTLPLLPKTFLSPSPWIKRLPYLALFSIFGLLLSAPHWIPFLDFLSSNAVRVNQSSITWANEFALVTDRPFPLNCLGYFTNLATPWFSEVHSAFGSSVLYSWLIAAIFFFLLLTIQRNYLRLLIFLAIFIYIAGIEGGVFTLFYQYFPTIKLSRIPGRMGIIIPIILLSILPHIITQIRESLVFRERALLALRLSSIFVTLCACAALIYITENFENIGSFVPGYTPYSLNTAHWGQQTQIFWTVSSIVAGLLLYSVCPQLIRRLNEGADKDLVFKRVKPSIIFAAWLVIFSISIIQTSYLLRYGSWTHPFGKDPTLSEYKDSDHLPFYAGYPFIASSAYGLGYGTATIPALNFYKLSNENHSTSCFYPIRADDQLVSNTYLPFYFSNEILCDSSWSQAFKQMSSGKCTTQGALFALEGSAICSENFLTRKRGISKLIDLNKHTKVVELTPHSLSVESKTHVNSIFVTSFPAVQGWFAEVDDKPSSIVEINGGLIGIPITAGKHHIRIYYYSAKKLYGYIIAGLSIGFLPAVLIHLLIKGRPNQKHRARLIPVSYILCGALGVIISIVWAQQFSSLTSSRILLKNSYQNLLELELNRWRTIRSETKNGI